MKNVENTTEQAILKVAEDEFLKKGFSGAKTTEIARLAGVTHAMLHYYYRTKENLFQRVFCAKVQIMADSLSGLISDSGSFEERLTLFIERHIDFLAQNPRLINFMYMEVISNSENRDLVLNVIHSRVAVLFPKIDKLVKEEIAVGRIRPIATQELLMNIMSLNISSFMLYPVARDILPLENPMSYQAFINHRKSSNVRFILSALRPELK